MENIIYNSMNSATRLLEKQAIVSNNLANISTTGFKEKLIYIVINKEDSNAKNISNNIKQYYNLYPGALLYTQRNLDLFVKDDGWLVVKDRNGREAYTKNGHITVNSKNQLVIQNHQVVGNNCKITIPINSHVKILPNGIITAKQQSNNNTVNDVVGQLKLVRLSQKDLIQKENGLFYSIKNIQLKKDLNIIPHNNNIRIQSGMLEESNVNPTKNMIDMISNAREFEMQMKIISMCSQNAEYANQLLNINS